MQHHHFMKRITTSVEPATYAALEDLARRDGVSTSHLLREAMARYVTERDQTLEPSPLPEWVGSLEGDGRPFAERDEELLDEWWGAELEALAPPAPPMSTQVPTERTPEGPPGPKPHQSTPAARRAR
jgi:predicted transcriptional regulator